MSSSSFWKQYHNAASLRSTVFEISEAGSRDRCGMQRSTVEGSRSVLHISRTTTENNSQANRNGSSILRLLHALSASPDECPVARARYHRTIQIILSLTFPLTHICFSAYPDPHGQYGNIPIRPIAAALGESTKQPCCCTRIRIYPF